LMTSCPLSFVLVRGRTCLRGYGSGRERGPQNTVFFSAGGVGGIANRSEKIA
jgi:hypothetical protein